MTLDEDEEEKTGNETTTTELNQDDTGVKKTSAKV